MSDFIRNVKASFFIAILFISPINFLYSQNYSTVKLTTREGLSQNDINDIYQDTNGFIWIGTNDGLNRYDGYEFKKYRINPINNKGISSNLVFNIDEDNKGNLWLGTSDEGICRFNLKTETFYSYKNTKQNPNLLTSNQIISLLVAKNGNVWVGTEEGIDILKFLNGKVHVEKIIPENTPEMTSFQIKDIVEDKYGRKWIGTYHGIYVFDERDNLLKVIDREMHVRDLFISEDALFVASLDGAHKISCNWKDLSDVKLIHLTSLNTFTILQDELKDLYLGTNTGIYEMDYHSLSDDYKLPKLINENWQKDNIRGKINSLFEDQSNNIWIGTYGDGIGIINRSLKKFRHYSSAINTGSLSHNKIRAIYEDRQENLWIGIDEGAVNFLPKSKGRDYESGFSYLNPNKSGDETYASSFIELNESGVLKMIIGTNYPNVVDLVEVSQGSVKEIDKGILSKVENQPYAFLKDLDNNIWVGTYGQTGLFKLVRNRNGEQILNFRNNNKEGSLSSNIIRSMLQDSNGNIWLGTDNGLNLLTPDQQNAINPQFVVFKKEEGNSASISHNYILPIFQSKDGTIWIGTMGGGLNKVLYHNNPDSIKFESITTNEGLPNDVIKGILEDDLGSLWISSNRGLTKFNTKDHIMSNYDISDGLQDYEFGELACCKRMDGELLFGGVNGFNAFYPTEINQDMSMPRVALTDFHILNQSVLCGEEVNGRVVLSKAINYTEKITLNYSENSFAIYFSSLHYSAPQKNKFKYILEGFDKKWVRKNANDRIAKYTNLSPGKYTFKVLASNNDGIWASNPKILHFIITPPWYLNNVSKVVYIAIFSLLLWFFGRYSLIRVKLKNELLMEHFETEKMKELSQMKLQFFTNISHEFRTPLSLILAPLERLVKENSVVPHEVLKKSHKLMYRNVIIMLKLINQLIDFRKFEQGKMQLKASNGNIVSFLKDIYHSFSEQAEIKHIHYQFISNNNEVELWYDNDKVERIMYNLLSNAFKYTHEEGEISLIVEHDDTYVYIKVKDNGIGISQETQAYIFERFYQAERIKKTKVGSTGIGLSFIKSLVEMHKGTITCESEENVGTTFCVKLPKGDMHLNDDQKDDSPLEENTYLSDFQIAHKNEPLRIESDILQSDNNHKPIVLVVEDNFELSNFIKEQLHYLYNIIQAQNGKEALEKIGELSPVLIISDIMMPVMDGVELCNKVKNDENICHIPIILLTAKSDMDTRIEGYKIGADAYISKPFSMDMLEVRVANLIESREKLREKLRTTITVEPSEVTTTSIDEKFLKRVLIIIENNISNPEFSVEQLADEYGMVQVIFHKKIKVLTGQSPKIFIRSVRLKRAAQLLTKAMYSVEDICYEVGFTEVRYFRNCFKKEYNMTPTEYSKKNRLV